MMQLKGTLEDSELESINIMQFKGTIDNSDLENIRNSAQCSIKGHLRILTWTVAAISHDAA
jgi:hypothetical protein